MSRKIGTAIRRNGTACAAALALWLGVLPATDQTATADPLPRQVLIEAQIWELSNDEGFDWGVIWDYDKKESSPADGFDIFSGDLRLPIFDESGDSRPKGLFASGDIFDIRFGIMNLRIQAALREGRAELLANPKVVVVEGLEATINSGEEVPIIKFTYDSKGNQTFKTIFEKTGVSLWVKAFIHEASPEYVLMDIRPEVKEITRFEKLTSPDGEFELPLLTRRSAQSKVMVRSGQTLVMGGLYQEQTISLERGAPLLRDIPGLGLLFRNKAETKEKRDLLIELRPTILLPGRDSFVPVPFSSRHRLRGGSLKTDQQQEPQDYKLPLPRQVESAEEFHPDTGRRSKRKQPSTSTGSWY